MVRKRTSDWIGKHCGESTNFKTLARAAGGLEAGDIYYVDLASGYDSGDGEDWDHAFLTINYAYDKVTADGNDYIIVRGWKTETGTGIIATCDVAQTHLIGHAGILNPYYPEKGSLYRSGAGDNPHTSITAEFVEFAGFAMNAKQSTGTESSGVSKGYLGIGTLAAAGGNKAFVHNIQLCDWNVAANVTGITMCTHYPVLRDIVVDNVYGNFDAGINIFGAVANSAYGTFENLYFQGGVAGAIAAPIKMASATSLQNSRFDGFFAQRCTVAIALGTAGGAYCSINNAVAGCAEAVFFSGGSACAERDDLWTNYKWTVGENVSGNDAKFQDVS